MTPTSHTSLSWFGKLPGAGDFAHRRMPPALHTCWDNWLHDGLADLRVRHPSWIDAYLTSPVWGFLLGPGIAGDTAWIGALAPSVDRVGRYYPISVFTPLPESAEDLAGWWHTAHHLLLQALESDADADDFEQLLAAGFTPSAESTSQTETVRQPGPGQTIWIHASHPQASPLIETDGLPRGPLFDLLFDTQPAAAQLEDGT
ncbi:MAG: type VI secretion system-associated protein TagF [Ottowia sp.]|uniref:type VI secretion system-associated protein TagF n=1 Tax=unclassified Ottowia TaxID=2645081 RepID=UPI003C2BAA71